MPKMKTHRGAAKRFKMTGTGRLRRRKADPNHILEKKSRPQAPPGRDAELTGGDSRHVKRQLGL